MEKIHKETFQEVKTAININNGKIGFSTDVWTNVATEAYLSVRCHYITDDWDMQSICLTTMLMQEEHTASNTAEMLEELVASYEIWPRKITAVVQENSAKVVAATYILEEKHGRSSVHCRGHILQFVINSAWMYQSTEKALGAER